MSIIKRTSADNTILEELNKKYPLLDSQNGVAYKIKLEYLTYEVDFLEETAIRDMRNSFGEVVISVIFYIRVKMCKEGWKVRIDNNNYNYLIDDCSNFLRYNIETINNIVQECIKRKVFYIVEDSNVEEGQWLTCIQQIYNFEMAAHNRQTSRERQRRARSKMKEKNNEDDAVIDNKQAIVNTFNNSEYQQKQSVNDLFGLNQEDDIFPDVENFQFN